MRALTLTLWVAGLLWIWADVYPALDRLDSQPIWQFSDVDEQGQAVRGDVTLRALILGLFALALTWVAARNLPGLLEIGLLSRIRIDAASVGPNDHLQDDLEIDSMDFLNLVAALHKRFGVDIPEADYPKIATLALAVAYLGRQAG